MAKGINLRTRLSLSRPSLSGEPTPRQLAAAIEDMQRNLTRWSDALPFGGYGFEVRRTNNDASIANGAGAVLLYNSVVRDEEGWTTGAAQGTFRVPEGGSGWYFANMSIYIGAPARSTWYPQIRVTSRVGTTLSRWALRGTAIDRIIVGGPVRLEEGEAIDTFLQNNSGFAIVPTFATNSNIQPYFPYFSVRRFALL